MKARAAALAVLAPAPLLAAALAAPSWPNYGGDPQHTAISAVPAQPLEAIRWSAPVDLAPQYSGGGSLLIHYGSPLATRGNTVVFPVKTQVVGDFRVEARSGADGALLWQFATDYVLPPASWTPSCGPCLTPRGDVYVPGAGGTVILRRKADRADGEPRRFAFFGNRAYAELRGDFDSHVRICTPITSDAKGNVYFGFLADDGAPLGLVSGFVRISASRRVRTTTAARAAGDVTVTRAAMNCAPALSRDGRTLYVAVRDDDGHGYLCALDAKSLKRKSSIRLVDPELGTDARVSDIATSSPTVGPDGDVYFGVLEASGSSRGFRGWLLHFDGKLRVSKTPGAFGWDDTASVVPASAVPSYAGASEYLVLCKYNDYAITGGSGVNRLAVLDPNAPLDGDGVAVMAEVLTVVGPTPDPEHRDEDHPDAVREWCINTAAVDPAGRCAFVNSEDGVLYRWDFVTNTLDQSVRLTQGIGEAYTPTLIGPDGTVYAINNGTLFAVGRLPE